MLWLFLLKFMHLKQNQARTYNNPGDEELVESKLVESSLVELELVGSEEVKTELSNKTG